MRLLTLPLLGWAVWAAASPVPLAAQAVPETPASAILHAWLDAFNSGDRARVGDYLTKYEPDRKDTVDRLMDFRERTGGFNLIRVEKSEATEAVALVKEKEGTNYAKLTLVLNPGEPPTVKQLGLNIVPRPPGEPEIPRLSFAAALQALEEKTSELTKKDQFSGAVLVARGGNIQFQKAYGLADREKKIANTVDMRFRIGSMNKMFTATAILQLVGEGKIDLAAPLGKYLPDYPNKDVATKVTLRHLLTHTGGTGDIFTPEYDAKRFEVCELSDYVKLYGSRDLEFEPGSKWSYSNYGFLLLGVVVEKVSGMSYYDYVRKNIFEEAGMTRTDSLPEVDKISARSTGYMKKDGAWVNNSETLPWRGTSAGGGYSTVGDLFLFAQALSSGKLIKPELFALMTSKQAGGAQMPPNAGYGFGMMVSEEPQGKRYGHGGGAPGMNGELAVYPQSATVVVVLSNLDPPAASRVADYFGERMPLK